MSICVRAKPPLHTTPPSSQPIPIGEGSADFMGDMHILPREMIFAIFKLFRPVELAKCAQINRLCWHISTKLLEDTQPVLNALLRLRLNPKKQNDASIDFITKPLFRANRIELTQTDISDYAIAAIATNLTRIEAFCLKTLSPAGFKKISEKALKDLVKSHPEIKSLYIGHCPQLKVKGIKTIVKTCPNLVELSLSNPHLNSTLIKKIVRAQPALERLTLTGASKVDDRTLEVIAQNCPQLQQLILHGCTRVTVVGLTSLTSLRALKNLILDECRDTRPLVQWMSIHKQQLTQLQSYHFYAIEE